MAPSVLSHGDGAPGAGAEDCIPSARRLWRAELGSSPRRRPTRCRAFPAQLGRWRVVCWVDILLDVISGVFLNAGSRGIFHRCFSNTNALPRINIGANVWGELNIMTGVY